VIEKAPLLEALRDRVRADLGALMRRQKDAEHGATHEESRAEHAKDTRATEQSYLARGLAERVAELQRTVDALSTLELRNFSDVDPIALTALVALSNGEGDEGNDAPETETWFLVPGAGGLTLGDGDAQIRTVTPIAPLGRALLGLRKGDEGALTTPRGTRHFEILEVR
jgi:hypothetical protein